MEFLHSRMVFNNGIGIYGYIILSEFSTAGGLLIAIVSYNFLCMVLRSLSMLENSIFSISIGCRGI